MAGIDLRAFDEPDEVREFELGKFELVRIGGMVVSGRAAVLMEDGEERVMQPGELFHVAPGHDSWVVGDEPYVSLHFLGAGDYAT